MKRIMTVDDSSSLRQIVSLVLGSAGYEVVEAVDGLDALSKLHGRELHLFLTDVHVPNMDGLELTRHLRGMPQYKFTPIVVLSGSESDPNSKQKAKASGATAWLAKPFTPGDLLAVVKKVCVDARPANGALER